MGAKIKRVDYFPVYIIYWQCQQVSTTFEKLRSFNGVKTKADDLDLYILLSKMNFLLVEKESFSENGHMEKRDIPVELSHIYKRGA